MLFKVLSESEAIVKLYSIDVVNSELGAQELFVVLGTELMDQSNRSCLLSSVYEL